MGEYLEIINITVGVLAIIGGVLSPLIGVIVWMFRKQFASREDLNQAVAERDDQIKNIHDRLKENDVELTKLNNHLSNLPTQDQFHTLALELRTIGGNIKTVSNGVTSIEKQVDGIRGTVAMLLENEVKNQ